MLPIFCQPFIDYLSAFSIRLHSYISLSAILSESWIEWFWLETQTACPCAKLKGICGFKIIIIACYGDAAGSICVESRDKTSRITPTKSLSFDSYLMAYLLFDKSSGISAAQL